MNKNVMIVLGGAVAIALLVAMLVQVSLGGKKKSTAVAQAARVEILVASKNLGIGRELIDGDLRWQEWPKSSVFPGAVLRKGGGDAEDALEGRLARDVAKGEPVMKSALLGQAKGNFVAASLKPGMRAVAIGVSASSMVGGFIGPGDFVDVILTYRESIATGEGEDARVLEMLELNLDKWATETILQNVKVLAVDQLAKRPDEDKIKVGKTITLAVGAEDAERLSLATELGDITLALRGVGDDLIVKKEWPTISDARLTSMGDEIFTEYNKLKKDSGINPHIVRIYNGSQVQVVPTK